MTPDLEAVRALLTETRALTLATLDPDGAPRATPLFFAFQPDLALLFLSDPDSAHMRNLARDPRAAVGLYPEVADWQEIRGLQMKGVVALVPQAERKAAMAVYQARFPFLEALAEAVEAAGLYRFIPRWVRLIDNRRGFGFHQEWALP